MFWLANVEEVRYKISVRYS